MPEIFHGKNHEVRVPWKQSIDAARAKRVSQSVFRCRVCGFEEDADLNAARNIRRRAGVNQPIVVCLIGSFNYKPVPLWVGS